MDAVDSLRRDTCLLGGIFIDDDRGWLVGAGATIIQTADGGDTWQCHELPQAAENASSLLRLLRLSTIDLGWAVGSGGTFIEPSMAVALGRCRTLEFQRDLYDVKFLDAMEGWAVGAEGTIIYTNDGGLHWTTQRSGTAHPLERIFFAGRTHGWAVGFGGTVVNYVRTEAPVLHR